MKKLILLALICTAILLSNCTPSPSPGPATPIPTPTPTYTMTATETALVGDWIWDSTVTYAGGNITTVYSPNKVVSYGTVITNTLYAGSHMDLKSSLYVGTQYYNADLFGNSFGGVSSLWYIITSASGNKLQVVSPSFMPFVMGGGNGSYITTLSTTKLIVQEWTIGTIANGTKAFYHK